MVLEPITRTCHEEPIAVNLGSCEAGRLLRGLSWMNMSSDDEMTDWAQLRDFLVRIPLAEWTETGLPHAISYKSRALFA